MNFSSEVFDRKTGLQNVPNGGNGLAFRYPRLS